MKKSSKNQKIRTFDQKLGNSVLKKIQEKQKSKVQLPKRVDKIIHEMKDKKLIK